MGRLSGKIAIVTGAASGIGAASAKLFADEGAEVLAVDRPESEIGTVHAGSNAIASFAADRASGVFTSASSCSRSATDACEITGITDAMALMGVISSLTSRSTRSTSIGLTHSTTTSLSRTRSALSATWRTP